MRAKVRQHTSPLPFSAFPGRCASCLLPPLVCRCFDYLSPSSVCMSGWAAEWVGRSVPVVPVPVVSEERTQSHRSPSAKACV